MPNFLKPTTPTTLEETLAGQLRTVWIAIGVIAVVLLLSIGLVAYGFTRVQSVEDSVARSTVVTAQQNVDARYDDCQSLNLLLAGMTTGVRESEKTLPLEYKLVPSLNTPQVKAVVRKSIRRELKAYEPRDCKAYALKAVPPGQVGGYHTP